MRRSRFRDEQIIGIVKQHQAGLSAQDLCRKYSASDATFYKCARSMRHGSVGCAQAEGQSRRLKKLLAESMLDAATQRDAEKKLLMPRSRGLTVTGGHELLAPRGCALVGLLAKTYRYTSRQSDDAPIRHRLLELAP
jgi:putative transposase